MSFFKEVENVLNASGKRGFGYNIVNYGGEALYIEGIKRILSIGTDKMRFDCKKQVVSVEGKALAIKEMEDGCVIIEGEIALIACEAGDAKK